MKTTIILLLLTGVSYFGAEAQTKHTYTTKVCSCNATTTKVKPKGAVAANATAHKHTKSEAKSSDTYQVCRQVGGHYECCTHKKDEVKTVTK